MFTQKNFCLTDEQYDTIQRWADVHKATCECVRKSCCGGEISVIFTPTTLGTVVSARCICGKEIELD